MRLPPLQPAGRFGWIAESARMQQPYAALYALPLSLSVTAKRPVGVGDPARPTPTLSRRRTAPSRVTVSVRAERSTSSSSRVRCVAQAAGACVDPDDTVVADAGLGDREPAAALRAHDAERLRRAELGRRAHTGKHGAERPAAKCQCVTGADLHDHVTALAWAAEVVPAPNRRSSRVRRAEHDRRLSSARTRLRLPRRRRRR